MGMSKNSTDKSSSAWTRQFRGLRSAEPNLCDSNVGALNTIYKVRFPQGPLGDSRCLSQISMPTSVHNPNNLCEEMPGCVMTDQLGRSCAQTLLQSRNAFDLEISHSKNYTNKIHTVDEHREARKIVKARLKVDEIAAQIQAASKVKKKSHAKFQHFKVETRNRRKTCEQQINSCKILQRNLGIQEQKAKPRSKQQIKKRSDEYRLTKKHFLKNANQSFTFTDSTHIKRTRQPEDKDSNSLKSANNTKFKVLQYQEDLMNECLKFQSSISFALEERKLQQNINKIRNENQTTLANTTLKLLDEDILKAKKVVWSILWINWNKSMLYGNEVANKARRKLINKVFSGWRNAVYVLRQENIPYITDDLQIPEKQQLHAVEVLYTHQTLSKYFCMWVIAISNIRQHRVNEYESERRKIKAQGLITRLNRLVVLQEQRPEVTEDFCSQSENNQTHCSSSDETSSETTLKEQQTKNPISIQHQFAVLKKKHKGKLRHALEYSHSENNLLEDAANLLAKSNKVAKNEICPPIDNFYSAMVARAEKRKERRRLLQEKYKAVELAKRAEEEKQEKDREMLLSKQKEEERALAVKRKQDKFDLQIELKRQQDAFREAYHIAKQHHRRKQLVTFGWKPWKAYWKICIAISHQSFHWYSLRLQKTHFMHWKAFLDFHHARKQQLELKRLNEACEYRDIVLKKAVLVSWKILHESIATKMSVVLKCKETYLLNRMWKSWCKGLSDIYIKDAKEIQFVTAQMQQIHLECVWRKWKSATTASQEHRRCATEKAYMWEKVRKWLDNE